MRAVGPQRRGSRERGGAVVEFAVCFAFLLAPLLMGTLTLGMNLIRTIQVTEVCRTAARLYASGTDFSIAANQALLGSLGPQLGLSGSGGNGILFLTKVSYLTTTDCANAGYSNCANAGKAVIVNRVVVGNKLIHAASDLGAPGCGLNVNGDVPSTCEFLSASDVPANFSSILASGVSPQETAYVAELWVTSPDLSFWNYLGAAGSSARSVFGQ